MQKRTVNVCLVSFIDMTFHASYIDWRFHWKGIIYTSVNRVNENPVLDVVSGDESVKCHLSITAVHQQMFSSLCIVSCFIAPLSHVVKAFSTQLLNVYPDGNWTYKHLLVFNWAARLRAQQTASVCAADVRPPHACRAPAVLNQLLFQDTWCSADLLLLHACHKHDCPFL